MSSLRKAAKKEGESMAVRKRAIGWQDEQK